MRLKDMISVLHGDFEVWKDSNNDGKIFAKESNRVREYGGSETVAYTLVMTGYEYVNKLTDNRLPVIGYRDNNKPITIIVIGTPKEPDYSEVILNYCKYFNMAEVCNHAKINYTTFRAWKGGKQKVSTDKLGKIIDSMIKIGLSVKEERDSIIY